MRTSKVSKETAKLFEHASGSVSPPRRTTRSSLARFAYATPSTATTATTENTSQTPDMEDAFGTPPARKRRRVASTVKPEPVEEVDVAKLAAIPSPTKATPRRARKPARKVTDPSTGEKTVAAPSDWEETYNVVREMRAPGGAAHGAAVDTMGCERLADKAASPKDQRFHTLIALMLSSQTKDTVNAAAMARLKSELPPYKEGAPPGLNLDNVLAVDPKLLNELIWTVGFHNNKTKSDSLSSLVLFLSVRSSELTRKYYRYIKKTADILRDEWDGDIPDTIEGLTSLPGVGPKMGYLCLSAAWDRTEGIGVDVHVHRITNLWGWNKTSTPEGTRKALQSWLPRDRWREINWLLVGLGQAVCLPQGRRCGDCELGLRGLCRAAERKKVLEGRRLREEETVKKEDGSVVKTEAVAEELAVKEEVVNEDEGGD